ncbi:MAG: LPS-assembly protein LptD [Rhodoferax sp.]
MASNERDETCASCGTGLRTAGAWLSLFAWAWGTTALAQTPASAEAPVYLQADRLHSRTDRDASLEGNVELRKSGTLIRADRLDYDIPSDTARATGHVWVQRNGNTYQGPYLELGIDAFEGFFTAPSYEFGQNGAHGQAARAEFVDNTHMTVYQASYTTCKRQPGPDWLPDWVLTAARIDIDNDEDIGLAQSAVLSFKGFPLLHVMPISFPLTEKRKSGMLPPAIGLDNANGLELSTPYYLDIAPNRDATFTPTLMTARGVNLGAEFRYLERGYSGAVRLSYMPTDKLRETQRWDASIVHSTNVDLPVGGVTLAANLNRVSDDNYWRDFTNSNAIHSGGAIAGATQRLLPADMTASWTRGDFSSIFKVLKWQTLQDPTAPIIPPYDRVPQWSARYSKSDAQGADWSLDLDMTQFQSDRSLTLQPNAQRAFGLAQISYPMLRPAGFVTPKLQLHTTSYQFDALVAGQQTATSTVPTFSLDSGLVLERGTNLFGRQLVQTLEPRAFYVYTPFYDQHQLPNYDTGANDFNFATIYTENAFVGNDKISDNNLLTLGLTTRYIDADNGAQLARFGVAQRLRFQDQKVTLDGNSSGAAAGVSDILLGAAANLTDRWVVDSTVQYNVRSEQSVRAVMGVRYSPSNFRVFNVAYSYQRELSEQIDTSWQWPLSDFARNDNSASGEGRYYALGRLNYSLSDGRLVNTVLGVEYDAGCWIGRLVMERIQTSVDSSNQRLMFQLEFVGFTRVGLSPEKTLSSNIPYYKNLRDSDAARNANRTYD